VFFLEKSSDFNAYSRSIESSHAENHGIKSNEDVNRQAHSQDEVASLLIVTISWIVFELVVIKLFIFKIHFVLVEPYESDETATDQE